MATAKETNQQDRYADAEKSLRAALKEAERFRPQDPRLATNLNNLALIYYIRGGYSEAEPLFKRSLAIMEKVVGPELLDVATTLNNMALLYKAQGKYAEAEPFLARARPLPTWHSSVRPSVSTEPWEPEGRRRGTGSKHQQRRANLHQIS